MFQKKGRIELHMVVDEVSVLGYFHIRAKGSFVVLEVKTLCTKRVRVRESFREDFGKPPPT